MAKKEKKEIEMTDQEKKAFAETVLGYAGKMIKFNQKTIRSNIISDVVMTPIIFGIVWWIGINPMYFAPFLLIGVVGLGLITYFAAVRSINIILKRASNGKIKYRQYKQLLKSGELENWLKLDGKATVEDQQANATQTPETEQTAVAEQTQNVTQVQNNGGVALSEEEVAVLQKLLGKSGFQNIVANQQPVAENNEQPKKPTDGRNA